MAPTNQMRRAAATVVGVDVTAHKEERHITDVKMARKQSNTRVRYYVELVVGSPRESHTRLGFSGTFKALLRLHAAFEAIFNAKHTPLKAPTSRESVSSATSASSASSSASNSHRRRVSAPLALGSDPDAPKIVGFPTSHALLVKLQPRQHVESDAKASARSDALFAYYSQLFNSEERELYLDYIQHRAERDATNKPTSNKPPSNNQHSHHAEEILHADEARGGAEGTTPQKRGFLKKLFGRRRHDGGAEEEETGHSSEHRRAAILDTKLEFAAPVHVTVKKNRRRM